MIKKIIQNQDFFNNSVPNYIRRGNGNGKLYKYIIHTSTTCVQCDIDHGPSTDRQDTAAVRRYANVCAMRF